jgi:hypothetical protein
MRDMSRSDSEKPLIEKLEQDNMVEKVIESDGQENEAPVLKLKTKRLDEYKGQTNLAAKPSQGLYILSEFGNTQKSVPIKMLIDSGAGVSLLDRKSYERIPTVIRPVVRESKQQITLADGSIQSCDGVITLNLKIGDQVRSVEFLLGHYSDEAILGMTDLQRMGLAIDFRTMLVTQGDLWIPVSDSNSNLVGRKVIVRRSVVIPKRTQLVYPARIEGMDDELVTSDEESETVMLEAAQSFCEEYGILPGKTLHQNIQCDIPVLLYNPSDENVVIHSGDVIGELKGVDCVYENEKCTRDSELSPGVKVMSCSPATDGDGELPMHMHDLYFRGKERLDEKDREKLHKFCCDCADVFSKGDFDIGNTGLVKHKIDTGDAKPIKQAPRRLSPEERAAADKLVDELLERKLISPSNSPWASNIVMAKKSDGSYRLCCDLRGVNSVTKKDGYPIPRIDETLESLGQAKVYASLDLASGYWQVQMSPESKDKTEFCTRKGLFQWERMPFGLTNAVATFQRLMQNILVDMQFTNCLVYIDDIFLYAKDNDTMFTHLYELCSRLRKANLKLKPKKCHLFQKSVKFLGHIISEEGVSTDPKKLEAVVDWKVPKDKKAVKSYLGFVGYYRRFIPNYSTIAKPLTQLTGKNEVFQWSSQCQGAFEKLKECLLSAPILVLPTRTICA